MASKLSDGNSGAFSERIPEGYQVFAVKVDPESSLSGLVLPGDKVDVLVFIKADSEARSGRKVTMDLVKQTGTRTILRNVSVFAVNDRIGRNVDEEETIVAKTVSLLVKPDESERLLLAKQLGTIHLALRKPGDESEFTTTGATPSDLNEVKQGGDGSELAGNQTSAKGSSDIFDMLEEMKAEPPSPADTSIATESSAAAPVTVIMSPTGIVGTFTHAKEGQLPQEMLRGVGALNATDANFDNSSTDMDGPGGDGVDQIDPIGDDDVDPESLGL
jgi:pilus assembly protein CpaB